MQPGRVFMKEHPSRAVKHTSSMVRIPVTHHSNNSYSSSSITASTDTHIAYAHVLGDVHIHNLMISARVFFLWPSKKLHKLVVKCSVNN